MVANRHRWAILPAGIAFGLALLTKGVGIYFLYLLCIVLPLYYLKSDGKTRRIVKDLAIAHFIALVFPVALTLSNGLQFGQWGGNGIGAILYYSFHPLFRGLDPPYSGLFWDHEIVLNGIEHASFEADTLYRGVAFEMLRNWRVFDLLESFTVKVKYFLFLAPREFGAGFRTYEFGLRAAMLILALAGFFWTQKRILAWLFGGMIVYQVAIHAPSSIPTGMRCCLKLS